MLSRSTKAKMKKKKKQELNREKFEYAESLRDELRRKEEKTKREAEERMASMLKKWNKCMHQENKTF